MCVKKKKRFKFSANINLDGVGMTYAGLSATFERSTKTISSRVEILIAKGYSDFIQNSISI